MRKSSSAPVEENFLNRFFMYILFQMPFGIFLSRCYSLHTVLSASILEGDQDDSPLYHQKVLRRILIEVKDYLETINKNKDFLGSFLLM